MALPKRFLRGFSIYENDASSKLFDAGAIFSNSALIGIRSSSDERLLLQVALLP